MKKRKSRYRQAETKRQAESWGEKKKITKKEKQLACHRGGAVQQRAAAPAQVFSYRSMTFCTSWQPRAAAPALKSLVIVESLVIVVL